MDRAPRSSDPPRSHRVVASAVTHRSHALVRSVTLPEHAAQPTLTSTLPFVAAEPTSSTRHSISSSVSGGGDPRVSVATSRGAAHAPAVWLFEDFIPTHCAAAVEDDNDDDREEEEEDEGLRGRRGSGARRSRYDRLSDSPHLSRPWMVDAIEVQPDARAEAPSPRVLDNRLLCVSGGGVSVTTRHHPGAPSAGSFPSFSQPSIEELAATSIPSHAAFVSAPPDDVTEDRRSAASTETTASMTDTRTKTWASATAVRERKAQRRQHQHRRHHLHHRQQQRSASEASSSSSSSSSEASSSSPPSSAQSTRVDMPPSALTSLRLSGSTEHHHHRVHNRPSTSGPSPASSISAAGDRLPLPRPRAATEDGTVTTATAAAASHRRASSVPGAAAAPTQCGGMEVVEGLGPLLVVHLDVLPELRHHAAPASPSPSSFSQRETEWAATGGGSGPSALVVSLDPASRHGDPAAVDPPLEEKGGGGAPAALHALVAYEAADAHTRELAALHARLEAAESRARLAEQQVSATAEVRAAALVRDYKGDERRRRVQFQSSLDALREENRDLTARLEAALRSPAVGLPPPSSSAVRVDGTPVGGSGGVMVAAAAAAAASSSSSALPFADVEVARQVHAVEAYWRDRLRTAEHHWEEEMTRQSQQRREALDQVEELVRTVEQSQEELRYTRRQAARLREENVRLSSAATAASAARVLPASAVGVASSSSPSSSAGEVERLRRALKEHAHREAALLAQVESYGEEATQVRLRCEAAVERAQQDVAAERRRSTEMVKLYGSQLESLHHQLREAKLANASR